MGLAEIFAIITTIATILGGVYGMLKHLLKDTHQELKILGKELKILEEDFKEFKNIQRQENLDFKQENLDFRKEFRAMNARMDGVYNLILNKLENK